MKFGAFPLLLLNSILSEKSSSTIGSGRGLAGLLRGGGGKPLPLEPEEVEGRESRSSPSSEDAPPAAEVEGVREVTELRPRKERAGGGDEMDIPESGELLLEEEEEEDKEEEGAAEEEDVHVVEGKDEDEEVEVEGEVDVVALEEGVEVVGDGSAFSPAFSDALIFASMLGEMMVPRMVGGGCHNTTSMLGFVNFFSKDSGSLDSPGTIFFTSSAIMRRAPCKSESIVPSPPIPSSSSSSSSSSSNSLLDVLFLYGFPLPRR